MDDLNVIDRFTETFVTYIESGFGLLSGDVAFLVSILVTIDIVLAGLFWALMGEDNIAAQLIRKVLYVGFFALLINNFQSLAGIVFDSFAGLGLKAGNAPFGADQLMRPGFVAATGFTAAWPMLETAGELIGFTTFFNNVVTIVVLLIAWLIVLLAFFVLSVQLFITIIEFKLTTLAGFVLVPFALFGKTAFLAERVLGNVITSGIKLMVLAIVLGIGSSIFGEIATPPSGDVDLAHAASVILAAISVFGLALFVPGIAAGLVSGAPQLGAGAAAGTAAGLVGSGVVGGMAASGALRGAGHLAGGGVKAAANMAGRTSAGVQSGGAGGAINATIGTPLKNTVSASAAPVTDSYRQGQASGFRANQSSSPSPVGGRGAGVVGPSGSNTGAPGWARKLHRRQRLREASQSAAHSLREGDRGAQGDGPKLDPDK
ncbi:P-type conjugative transfer protein TrbL [Hoeflea sp.]|uniref:P-type conjugative transfer protein TrbL n=1 Tax=Hoeflea sp. TaxID=1940281 RepID=UPI003B011EF8